MPPGICVPRWNAGEEKCALLSLLTSALSSAVSIWEFISIEEGGAAIYARVLKLPTWVVGGITVANIGSACSNRKTTKRVE